MKVETQVTPRSYESRKPGWCPGCGHYGFFNALKKALFELEIMPYQTVLVGGIGCSGKIADYVGTYSIHTLHGRVIPVATGIKLANPGLFVIGVSGDGDALAIGMSHFMHACRRNLGISYFILDNQVYSLTKGQASPTSFPGMRTTTTPAGVKEAPIDAVTLGLAGGATFVARGFSGNPKELTEIIKRAILHKGFAVVDVLSPCVTFNRAYTYDWYRKNIEDLGLEAYRDMGRPEAIAKVVEIKLKNKIPVGIFYVEERGTLEEELLENPERAPVFENLEIRKEEYLRLMERYR